jgi:hypothetical protein
VPAFLALRLFSWGEAGGEGPAGGGGTARALAAELIGFAVAWAGFALASLAVADAAGRRARWPRFIAAWNYTNVVQYLALVAGTMLPAALGLPAWVVQVTGLAALGYALWLEWYVVRLALAMAPLPAAGLVALDLVLGLFVGGLTIRLSGG